MRTGAVGRVEVTDLVTDLRALAGRFDPDVFAAGEVIGVLADLGRAVRLVEGMAVLMARRATEVTSTAAGAGGAVELLARASGSTPTQAKTMLATSTRLRGQAAVAGAVREGTLSGVQAAAVADAVLADPTAEGSLLVAAGTQSMQELRRTCRDVRMAADPDRSATRARHLARRSFRAWTESDGEWRAMLSGPADHGARFEAALRGEHDRVFRAAHAAGVREEDAVYRYDALLALLERGADVHVPASGGRADERLREPSTAGTSTGPAQERGRRSTAGLSAGTPAEPAQHRERRPGGAPPADTRSDRPRGRARSGRQAKVIVVVDAAALKRGSVAEGETCTIAGIGQVSLDAVKALIPDAHIAYVIRDAVDATVVHRGRQATAAQRTALEARGYVCEVPGCRADHLLEIDHVRDWAWSHQTVLADLAWLCGRHHGDKSTRGHRLTGPPGLRTWTTRDGRILSTDRADPPDRSTPGDGTPRAADLTTSAPPSTGTDQPCTDEVDLARPRASDHPPRSAVPSTPRPIAGDGPRSRAAVSRHRIGRRRVIRAAGWELIPVPSRPG